MYPRRKWRLVDDFQTARVRGGSDMIGKSEFPLYVHESEKPLSLRPQMDVEQGSKFAIHEAAREGRSM